MRKRRSAREGCVLEENYPQKKRRRKKIGSPIQLPSSAI
jgi:hypothetical protein